jgi:hypothetical protein
MIMFILANRFWATKIFVAGCMAVSVFFAPRRPIIARQEQFSLTAMTASTAR